STVQQQNNKQPDRGPGSAVNPTAPPQAGSAPKSGASSRITTLAIVSGLLGFLLFIATPFLPVNQQQSSFSWPQNGDLRSVTAPLISYSPESLDLSIPLSEIDKLNNGQSNVLSTVPEGSKEETLRGLFVRNTDSGLDVIIRNVVPLSLKEK